MLGVAARIPDPATRDQFADRLAHKARVTEEVVRAEIRKAAAARKTELPEQRIPTLAGHIRGAERGLLWGLVHQPALALPWIRTLEDEDLEGLSSSLLLRMARELSDGDPEEAPNILMARLSTEEAHRLAAIAAEPSAPVLDAESAVLSLKRMKYERQLAAVQRQIDGMQARGDRGADLLVLLQRKMELGRLLGPENS
jgi:hypothetical protein